MPDRAQRADDPEQILRRHARPAARSACRCRRAGRPSRPSARAPRGRSPRSRRRLRRGGSPAWAACSGADPVEPGQRGDEQPRAHRAGAVVGAARRRRSGRNPGRPADAARRRRAAPRRGPTRPSCSTTDAQRAACRSMPALSIAAIRLPASSARSAEGGIRAAAPAVRIEPRIRLAPRLLAGPQARSAAIRSPTERPAQARAQPRADRAGRIGVAELIEHQAVQLDQRVGRKDAERRRDRGRRAAAARAAPSARGRARRGCAAPARRDQPRRESRRRSRWRGRSARG